MKYRLSVDVVEVFEDGIEGAHIYRDTRDFDPTASVGLALEAMRDRVEAFIREHKAHD